jgi:toxin ParE1/3/4
MRQLIWAAAAIADLNAINAFLLEEYGEAFAEHAVGDLVKAARWLIDYPHAGPLIGSSTWRKWRPRRSRYILVYAPTRDGIHVLRVRHERNDWRPVSGE